MALDWYTVQLLTPLPSTKIYDQMVDLGLIESDSLNTDGDGYTMFSVRESERQRRKEEFNQKQLNQQENPLDLDVNYIPSKKELTDLWFFIDFEVNYKRISTLQDQHKSLKLRALLQDVSDRMTRGNPLSNYYLSILEEKLNNFEEANYRQSLSFTSLNKSESWRNRFQLLELNVADSTTKCNR